MNRSAGILLPLSSLPSKYGIGCFSKSAYEFVAPAGTGMDELIIFQINTYMTGNPFFSAVMEEYQISFAQVFLTYFINESLKKHMWEPSL